MHTDSFFSIGSAHGSQGRPCEDYALSGELPSGMCFGVVADGCSGVNAHTDVGARAVAWAYLSSLQDLASGENMFPEGHFASLVECLRGHLFTGKATDYLATLIGFVGDQSNLSVLAHGDGAVALRYSDGRMALIELEWRQSMPFYLAYNLSEASLDEFLSLYQNSDVKPFIKRTTVFMPTDAGPQVLSTSVEAFPVSAVLQGHVVKLRPTAEGIDCLAVISDGYSQIGTKTGPEVAQELLNYKSYQGAFVKRRMLRALKSYQTEGAGPRDDIGIAAVWFGSEAAN